MGDNGTHGSLLESVGEEADKIGALWGMFLTGSRQTYVHDGFQRLFLLPIPHRPPLQANFVKNWMPVCDWAMLCGEQVAEVVEAMEKNSKISANTFKALEQFRVPEDHYALLATLKSAPKPTGGTFATAARDILLQRYWRWVLTHKDLGPEHIHESRSMLHASHQLQGGGNGVEGCATHCHVGWSESE